MPTSPSLIGSTRVGQGLWKNTHYSFLCWYSLILLHFSSKEKQVGLKVLKINIIYAKTTYLLDVNAERKKCQVSRALLNTRFRHLTHASWFLYKQTIVPFHDMMKFQEVSYCKTFAYLQWAKSFLSPSLSRSVHAYVF